MKRVLKILALGVVLTLTASSVAWAHTTVSPGQAAAGEGAARIAIYGIVGLAVAAVAGFVLLRRG